MSKSAPANPHPPSEPAWPADAVFTVGHSTHPLDAFIALVRAYGIERIADIRTVPRSRRNPQFNAETLGPALGQAQIDYAPLRALGGLRHPRNDSPNRGWRNESFRGYADYMQTEGFEAGLAELIGLAQTERTAIMCAEAVPWRCHRSLVADALLVRGLPAVEILSQTGWRLHELTSFAHVEGTRITYPQAEPPAVHAP
jgi:uncharacterized protein (DUF488 family)